MAVKTTPIARGAAEIKLKSASGSSLPRVVFVVGQTSSGKTDLGLRLAKSFNGEIINADARQVYTDLDIGTGKPRGKRGSYEGNAAFIVKGIPHYLMDFLPPDEAYSAPQWKDAAMKAILGITSRNHVPIIVGGTGLYIASLINNFEFPEVPAKPGLRKEYERKEIDELVALLLALDPKAKNIVDLKNKRRIIRALEVVTFTGKPFSELRIKGDPLVDAIEIGILRPMEEIYQRIDQSIDNMVEEGMIDEVRRLLNRGISVDSPGMTAIGYRDFSDYLEGKSSLEEAVSRFKKKTRNYARRQWTWFKKDTNIKWAKSMEEAETIVRAWLEDKNVIR